MLPPPFPPLYLSPSLSTIAVASMFHDKNDHRIGGGLWRIKKTGAKKYAARKNTKMINEMGMVVSRVMMLLTVADSTARNDESP